MTDTLVSTEDMTEEEGARLIALERDVEKALRSAGRIAGAALAEIRDQRLYRASHRSFEAYLLERHGLSKSTGYAMIAESRRALGLGLTPEVAAIGAASARAAERRHVTLDQPPTTIDPHPEPLRIAPEPDEDEPDDDDEDEDEVLYHEPCIPVPTSIEKYETPTQDRPGTPGGPERNKQVEARKDLNRLSIILAKWEGDWATLAAPATRTERLMISKLAAAVVVEDRKANRPEGVVDPAHCDHPVGRRIGNQCGKCGAVRKAGR